MSNRRRPTSRKTATKQPNFAQDEKSNATIASRPHRTPHSTTTTKMSNKRTRIDSNASNEINQKKRKEILSDNNDDVEEVPPEKPSSEKKELDRCAICLDDCTDPKRLDRCSHTFCTACIDYYFQTVKPQCPCCFTIYGEIRGNQPNNGTMTIEVTKHRLPGFEHDSRGTIRITYHFPNGTQDESHPNPGTPYYGTTRHAYLPDNHDGREVLTLLQRAFDLRQIFTVGQSRTTGYDNVITWNDIHHKTSIHGGIENFGYPDKTYLNRVKQELAAKGIQ